MARMTVLDDAVVKNCSRRRKSSCRVLSFFTSVQNGRNDSFCCHFLPFVPSLAPPRRKQPDPGREVAEMAEMFISVISCFRLACNRPGPARNGRNGRNRHGMAPKVPFLTIRPECHGIHCRINVPPDQNSQNGEEVTPAASPSTQIC